MYRRLTTLFRGRSPREIVRLAGLNLAAAVRALTSAARRAKRAEGAFDRRWGTDTAGEISVRALGFTGEQLRDYHRYGASSEAMVAPAIARLGIDPAAFHFIDYGAGKGRALMFALQLGFTRVTGVELSAALCEVAKRNLTLFRAANPDRAAVVVHQGDATAYRPEGPRILAYFYNPFGAKVMAAVRATLEAARDAGAEAVHVVYANPEHGTVFESPGWRTVSAEPGVSVFTYRG